MPLRGSGSSSSGDSELMSGAAKGDQRALTALYDRYGSVVYAVAYRIVGEHADAEDVLIDTFSQAWREASRFQPDRGSVAGWLAMIARSRALDLVRARGRHERAAASAMSYSLTPPAMGTWPADPSDSYELAERRRQVTAALEALSPPQRQVIELAFFHGLSQSEIAQRLNEPLGTVKTRVRLGMQKLRDALRPSFFDREEQVASRGRGRLEKLMAPSNGNGRAKRAL